MSKVRTAVVLFTDLVASTARDRRLGAEAADAFRRDHFAQSAGIVGQHDGWLVKSMGDGLMAVFESPTGAIRCAVALQQHVSDRGQGLGDPPAMRIGLSAGEILVEESDCFGAPVVEAARLCAEAEAGEIFIADIVRVLSRSMVHPLRSVGAKTLKGLDVAVEVYLVEWRPAVEGQAMAFVHIDSQSDFGERAARALETIGSSPHMVGVRDRMTELLAPRPGESLLDVGCGVGVDVTLLSSLVAPRGRVIGLDQSDKMVRQARARAAELELCDVEFVVGDAEHLEFSDDSFDGVRSDRVFQYLLEPVQAIREIARVTRPGGRIVVSDTDWETAVFDSPDDALTARINRAWLDTRPNGRAGRQLFRLFKLADLTEVAVEARTQVKTDLDDMYTEVIHSHAQQAVDADAVTSEEASRWIASLEAAAANRHLPASVHDLHRFWPQTDIEHH